MYRTLYSIVAVEQKCNGDMTQTSADIQHQEKKILYPIYGQTKDDVENANIAQVYAYDSLRGSENTSPKSFEAIEDSQSSIEDKV